MPLCPSNSANFISTDIALESGATGGEEGNVGKRGGEAVVEKVDIPEAARSQLGWSSFACIQNQGLVSLSCGSVQEEQEREISEPWRMSQMQVKQFRQINERLWLTF